MSLNSPLHPGAAPRLSQIEKARHAALHAGELQGASHLAPWVQRSWQRCLAMGMDPSRSIAFEAVSQSRTRLLLEANQPLLKAAAPVIRSLSRAMANTRYFAILTDAQGVVIDVNGPVDRQDPRAADIARVGVDLSERTVGTTAIGTTLSELQPVWLHRGEHFFESTTVYSCAGAPIWGPDGHCVGMLDLTGINVPEQPALKHLVAQSARSIENALTLSMPHALMLRMNWPGRVLGDDNDGLLCLDEDGLITALNRPAADMLDIPPGVEPGHCTQHFAVPMQALFDAGRAQAPATEMPLWSGLRLQVLAQGDRPARSAARSATGAHAVPLKDIETALIRKAVDDARGNVMDAARALGISRATVYRKLGAGRGKR
ncbi:helix-turn-helix domain-containing protein [Hydrogenophaga sp. IBVHS2]|uniref:helix-turn-helix domain-containing protein n=1 Tax=Hydrogenophaga sp. IBVHS2 TaxID=1985170 RepID=UPI00211A6290|nr:helix-turn-helix domain-containing protein [Hydrogenophaga sp. IBVHS2]